MSDKRFFRAIRQYAEISRRTGRDYSAAIQRVVDDAALAAVPAGTFVTAEAAYAHYRLIAEREVHGFKAVSDENWNGALPF